MNSGWSETPIGGVLRRSVAFHTDGRGAFGEAWRDSWTQDLGERYVQANLSMSEAGVLRGLHFHHRQTDLWVVLEGRAHVALVDIRPLMTAAKARPQHLAEVFEPGDTVLIPPGVAHGFWALDDLRLLYLVTNEYDGTDELGFAWDDPSAAVKWPAGAPVLSERDANAQSLEEALRAIGKAGPSLTR